MKPDRKPLRVTGRRPARGRLAAARQGHAGLVLAGARRRGRADQGVLDGLPAPRLRRRLDDKTAGKFNCPCHTSAFDLDGRCLEGPFAAWPRRAGGARRGPGRAGALPAVPRRHLQARADRMSADGPRAGRAPGRATKQAAKKTLRDWLDDRLGLDGARATPSAPGRSRAAPASGTRSVRSPPGCSCWRR